MRSANGTVNLAVSTLALPFRNNLKRLTQELKYEFQWKPCPSVAVIHTGSTIPAPSRGLRPDVTPGVHRASFNRLYYRFCTRFINLV
jgi:hypothetical protein